MATKENDGHKKVNYADRPSAGSKAAAGKIEPVKGELGVMVVGLDADLVTHLGLDYYD
jgi:hypothetical protein